MEDRFVEITDQEVRIEFELNRKCRAKVRLRSLVASTRIAFKVQTSSPEKFLVNPPNGFIAPLSYATFQVILKPQSQLPSSFPRSSGDRFLIRTAKFIPNSAASNHLDSLNLWFTSIPPHTIQDLKLKVALVGPVLLRHAVSCGDLDAVKSIIKRQRSIVSELSPSDGESLRRVASESDNAERMIKLLVEAGLDPEAESVNRYQVAVREEDKRDTITIQRVVLESSADEDIKSKNGEMERAIANDRRRSSIEVARDKRHKEGVEVVDKGELVLVAARKGEVEQLKSLLQKGASSNYCDQYGMSALHAAAIKGHTDAVKMLVEFRSGIECKDKEDHTPLHVAVTSGSIETVEVLIRNGANVNAQNKRGTTPLHIARLMGYEDICQFLIDMGAYSLPSHSFPSLIPILE